MTNPPPVSSGTSTWVDHIPVLWFEPLIHRPERQLILFLPHFRGAKEQTDPFLQDMAAAGFVALSFDPWHHGARGTESQEEIAARVFGNFRRYMWPILGQTTLDALRVIDWAMATLDVGPSVFIGGLSMGGDIAVATPDWLRPGMQDAFNPGVLLPPGEPDAYAQYFYDPLNPLSHLVAYAHGPEINFICGEHDTHVPPDGALRFQAALRATFPVTAAQIQVNFIPGMGHLDVRNPDPWWPDCLAWLTRA